MRHTNNRGPRNKCAIESVEVIPKGGDITPKGVVVTSEGVKPASEGVQTTHSRQEVDPNRFGVDQEWVEVTIEGGEVVTSV